MGTAIFATCASEDEAVGGFVHSRLPHFAAVDDVASVMFLLDCSRLHESGIAAVTRFGESECDSHFACESAFDQFFLLLLVAEVLPRKKGDNMEKRVSKGKQFFLSNG